MRFSIETLGCKVNQFETQALELLLTSRGHTECAPGEDCDACIINTCAVTAESGRKSRQAIRRAKKAAPSAVIAVCGCYSQISPEEVEELGVDLISGSGERAAFVTQLEAVCADRAFRKDIDDPMKRREFESLPTGGLSGRTRAMLKIQDGCCNFCTYCVIPYARGPVRSLPLEDTAAEAARLMEAGYREIVVTGIEISSYGRDLENVSLIDAVRAVSKAAPECRIRLGSLEPRTVTDDFADALVPLENVCRHFHLSLQSGCDATLRRMGRRYDTARFMQSVSVLRDRFPGCGLTTDLIVGFPGETEEEFGETMDFIRGCAFSAMHVFPYSPRPGTPAADMPGQISRQTKHERARIAGAAAHEMKRAFLESCIGSVQNVLFETESGGWSRGHAGNYAEVSVNTSGLHNRVLPVLITGVNGDILLGKLA
ncbi:MAG: tRNA (N(6)-L-threonylcarbamoyladenosine(37)-C(2))-methylthiotransferase MtaB [Oscillospiraceae bacterium]|nr:tRNA (N(6)-L-threonylcarbamoyladenosine(37)-C(2))-methylthiotransferase MtaB [Oscillospiraceae bacterium]